MAEGKVGSVSGSTQGFDDIDVVDPGEIGGYAAADIGHDDTYARGDSSGGDGSDGDGNRSAGRKPRRRRRTREEIERDAATGGRSTERERQSRGPSAAQTKATIDTTTALLFSVHQMLAGMTQYQELAITQEEARAMAEAATHVQSFYPTKANAKALAWGNLAMIAGAVYGPRIVAIMKKPKRSRSTQNRPGHPINTNYAYPAAAQ